MLSAPFLFRISVKSSCSTKVRQKNQPNLTRNGVAAAQTRANHVQGIKDMVINTQKTNIHKYVPDWVVIRRDICQILYITFFVRIHKYLPDWLMIVIGNVAIGGLFQTKNYWKNFSVRIHLCLADNRDIKRISPSGNYSSQKKYCNLDFIDSIKLFSRFFVRIQSSLDFTMERLQSAHAVRSQKEQARLLFFDYFLSYL